MARMISLRFIPRHAHAVLVVMLLAAVCFTLGCVERTISVTSDPPGALVYLNDQEVGRTPVSVPFTFYGMYGVRLEHEGFQPVDTQREAVAPWWEAPGPDLIAELVPNNRVEIGWHFNMDLQAAADEDRVIDRASQLRAMLRRESPAIDMQVVEPASPDQATTPASSAGEAELR